MEACEEMMKLCAAHLRKKYQGDSGPLVFAVFAGSGLSHGVCASMPKDITGMALRDAGEAMLNGTGEDVSIDAPTRARLN